MKRTQKTEIFDQKFAHFDGFDGLTILGLTKVPLGSFSKWFCSCLGSVKVLFLDLKGLLVVVFSALTVYT